MDFEPPHDDEGDPKKIFWKMLTYQLNARDSRSGQYGPSPLESLPSFLFLFAFSFLVLLVLLRLDDTEKFSVVVAEVCG